jgi:hypothetical protein
MKIPNIHRGSELDETKLLENYETFIQFLKDNFSGERLEKMLLMYNEENFGTVMTLAPVSPFHHFHNCFPGGYIQHLFNLLTASIGVQKTYEVLGGEIDYTEEELIFSILHHDLGKLGSLEKDGTGGEYYVPQTSEWHIKNKGEVYKLNDNLQYFEVSQRALYLLQSFGIKFTWKEHLGIILADGMYSESASKYLKVSFPGMVLKTNLPYIVHTCDYLATKSEYCVWKRENE